LSRALRFLALLCGIGLVAWLVSRADIAALLGIFRRIGWGFAAILALRGAAVCSDTAAWACLLPPQQRPPFTALLPLRWVGESINTTLPAAQIGGEVVRARLLQQRVCGSAYSAGTVAIDFCLSLLVQIIFTSIGFLLLVRLSAAASLWPTLVCTLLIPLFAVASWELLVRQRLLAAATGWAKRLGQHRVTGALRSVGEALRLVAASRQRLALSLAWHSVSWLVHIGELWLTLWLMGAAIGVAEAAMLESLSLAARSAAFLIPSGWGAQEAALIGLAGLTGLAPETALALGLVKRAREFAVGLPGLVAWALLERRRPGPSA